MSDTKADYVEMMATQMKKWDADVDALTAKGDSASASARATYQEGLKDLRASRDAAQEKFMQMSAATEAANEQMQAGMTAAWESMKKSFETFTLKQQE